MAFRPPSGRACRGPRPASPRGARVLRSRPAGGPRLQERGPGVPARVLLGAAALAGGGRHLAGLGAAGRRAASRDAGSPGAPREVARGDRDLDRPLHRAGAARRRDLRDRSDLGRPERSLQRVRGGAPLHPARHRVRRAAPHRLRPDLARPLRRPDRHRPGPSPLVLVGGARVEALLLRRGHRLLPSLQGDGRSTRAVRPGRAAHRVLHAARDRQARAHLWPASRTTSRPPGCAPSSSGGGSTPPPPGSSSPAKPGPGSPTASSTGPGSSRAAASRTRD
jgi:hypothetical protein